MKIDESVVRKMARLAYLELPRVANEQGELCEPDEHLIGDEQLSRMAKDLNDIIEYVQQLNELDLTDVEPTSHGVPLPSLLRSDIVGEPLSSEATLQNAPAKAGTAFRVPKVIE